MNFWLHRLGTICYSLKGTQTSTSGLSHPRYPPQNPAEQRIVKPNCSLTGRGSLDELRSGLGPQQSEALLPNDSYEYVIQLW